MTQGVRLRIQGDPLAEASEDGVRGSLPQDGPGKAALQGLLCTKHNAQTVKRGFSHKKDWVLMFNRPGQNQGLLYKQARHCFIDSLTE